MGTGTRRVDAVSQGPAGQRSAGTVAAGPCPPRLAALAAAPGGALRRAAQGRPDMTKVPSTYEVEGTSPGPGPAWPVARSSGAAGRRRGRTPAQAAGFPAPPASRSRLRMVPVSNGESILTVPPGGTQGSAGIHFWFFRHPHLIHRRRLVIRIRRQLSTSLCTICPQVPWITS